MALVTEQNLVAKHALRTKTDRFVEPDISQVRLQRAQIDFLKTQALVPIGYPQCRGFLRIALAPLAVISDEFPQFRATLQMVDIQERHGTNGFAVCQANDADFVEWIVQ